MASERPYATLNANCNTASSEPVPHSTPSAQPKGETRLALNGVSYEVNGQRILDNVSMQIEADECWAVLGPNGAGKSTLVRIAAQAIRPSSGTVDTCGLPWGTDARTLAQRVAWVPQHPDVAAEFSVLDIVLMGRTPFLPTWGFPSSADVQLARDILQQLDIATLAERSIHALSGGEARRVWLARALVQQPRLLLLDEPTAFLDLRHQIAALQVVHQNVQQGMAAVNVLHDINLAARVATHVLLLKQGRALAQGPIATTLTSDVVSELYDWPIERAEAGQQFIAKWK